GSCFHLEQFALVVLERVAIGVSRPFSVRRSDDGSRAPGAGTTGAAWRLVAMGADAERPIERGTRVKEDRNAGVVRVVPFALRHSRAGNALLGQAEQVVRNGMNV